MTEWADAVARARGLGNHLLERRRLDELAASPDVRTLTRRLRALAYPRLEETSDPLAAERALHEEAGRRRSLLIRWLGPRAERLTALLDADEIASIRTLLRGAAQGAAPAARLAGAPPSPGLSASTVEELARAPSPAAVAERLAALGHPFGEALIRGEPAIGGLLGLELRLARAWSARAAAGARDRDLRDLVGRAVDLANAWTVLAAHGERDFPWEEAFLEGGAQLEAEAFRDALGVEEPEAALSRLAGVFAGGPLGPAFRDPGPGGAALERRALEALVAEQRRRSRARPLGPAPVLLYLLRLRLELTALRSLLWGRVLGAPPTALARELPRVA